MRYKRVIDFTILGLLAGLLVVPSARSTGGGVMTEDFTTDTHADYSNTTGLWNLVDNEARAKVVSSTGAGGTVSGTVDFGDGSDGDLISSGGAQFDTDAHPNGFNYRTVNISGGTITVTGRHALVIRALKDFTIGAGVTIQGLDGTRGQTGVASSGTATTAGTAATCQADGGAGGGADNLGGQTPGTDDKQSDGSDDPGTGGTAAGPCTGGNSCDANASAANLPGNPSSFDAGGFICGPGGGGGSGGSSAGNFASGGAGGGGGGRIRIAAVGAMSIKSVISAKGGDAGNGKVVGGTTSGCGAPGNGGAVWLQSLHGLSVTAVPVVGPGAVAAVCETGAGVSAAGFIREDDSSGALTHGKFTNFAAASSSYIVQSKGYNLDTLNAGFDTPSIVSSAGDGQTPLVEFAASADDTTYSPFTKDITTLSGQGYSYLKFRITITTGSTVGNSPTVSKISVPFNDLGLQKLDLKLSPGCGTITGLSDRGGRGPGATAAGLQLIMGWLAFWLLAYRVLRRSA